MDKLGRASRCPQAEQLLMRAVSRWCRPLLTVVLVCVWAMPQVVSTLVFHWLFDYQFGVVNWLLRLNDHDWYADPLQVSASSR